MLSNSIVAFQIDRICSGFCAIVAAFSFKTSIKLTMFLECDCRCEDANLINVPVLVGRLDRSFYRVAFFTKRIVQPYEELTWDYGINFL